MVRMPGQAPQHNKVILWLTCEQVGGGLAGVIRQVREHSPQLCAFVRQQNLNIFMKSFEL